MTIDFYYIPGSAPCRSVLLTAKALGLELNLKLTNLMAGEHMTPEFVKMNPQHTVPTLNDNGFVLWESRAICAYLVEKYGKDDSLYPKDAQKRALVNQRLYFDAGTLYQRFGDYVYPHYFAKAPLDAEKLKKLDEGLGFFDTFLKGNEWAAGNTLTIADLALVASIATMDIVGIDVNKYDNVAKWFAKCKKSVVGYELNQEGALKFKEMVDHLTGKA